MFVVGRRSEDLSLKFRATFKSSHELEVWVFNKKSANALVRQAETNGTLQLTNPAVKRILSLTGRHPFLTQLLCQRIWEQAYASRISGGFLPAHHGETGLWRSRQRDTSCLREMKFASPQL